MTADHRVPGSDPVAPDIRIAGLNTDKTRKVSGPHAGYQVFFELSGAPPPEWKRDFAVEWKKVKSPHAADIEESFLILHCQLNEVTPAQVSALQKTIVAANRAYKRFALGEASAVTHREEERVRERQDVEAVASSLHFD